MSSPVGWIRRNSQDTIRPPLTSRWRPSMAPPRGDVHRSSMATPSFSPAQLPCIHASAVTPVAGFGAGAAGAAIDVARTSTNDVAAAERELRKPLADNAVVPGTYKLHAGE